MKKLLLLLAFMFVGFIGQTQDTILSGGMFMSESKFLLPALRPNAKAGTVRAYLSNANVEVMELTMENRKLKKIIDKLAPKPMIDTHEEQVKLQLPATYSIIKMHHKEHDHVVAEQSKFAYYTLVEEDLINDINYSILLKEFQDCSIKGCGFKNRTIFKDSTLSLYEKFSKVHVDWKIVSEALN